MALGCSPEFVITHDLIEIPCGGVAIYLIVEIRITFRLAKNQQEDVRK
jgi:hypothetical protein